MLSLSWVTCQQCLTLLHVPPPGPEPTTLAPAPGLAGLRHPESSASLSHSFSPRARCSPHEGCHVNQTRPLPGKAAVSASSGKVISRAVCWHVVAAVNGKNDSSGKRLVQAKVPNCWLPWARHRGTGHPGGWPPPASAWGL